MSVDPALAGPSPQPDRLVVWDAATRLFHWTLVLMIALLWWTGEKRMLDWHRLAGYCLAALLVFRFFWGVVGSETARFSHFVRGPLAVARYIGRDMFRQGARPRAPGHNPLGGWSVVAMLLLLTTQVGLGMIAVDVDGIESGPLSHLVEFDTGRRAAGLHALLFNILLALIALHVVAALAYLLFGRENLVGAMLSGRRHWFGERPELAFASRRRAVTVFAASATLVAALIWYLGG